jgi:methionyl-tRNA formyltransferase
MRVVILTSSTRGFASLAIPFLEDEPSIEIAKIVYAEGRPTDPAKARRRKIQKARQIGILGALNGIRMRSWYSTELVERLGLQSIEAVARAAGCKVDVTPRVNCPRTRELFEAANADLGLSLGNPFIGRSTFSIPRCGMINIHCEVLPQFRGAQGVIWQIHEGSKETGFTFHQIDDHIDTGSILYQERLPIEFQRTLKETVLHNYARVYAAAARGLVQLIRNYGELATSAGAQGDGRSFTTPSIWQFLRMVRQNRRFYDEARRGGAA